MYILHQFVFTFFLFFSLITYLNADSATSINTNGGRTTPSNSNYSSNVPNIYSRINSQNAFDRGFYEGTQSSSGGYYNYVSPVPPVYDYNYYDYSSNNPGLVFPDAAESNSLYWGEVQQMER